MRAVFRHELSGYFTTPVGYVFLTMYALLSGLVFVFINIGQEMSASMNLLFSGMQLPLMLIAPLLTMRLFAEEKRMRTDQLLLTSPVPLGQIVLGKALASLALLMIAMLLALIPALFFAAGRLRQRHRQPVRHRVFCRLHRADALPDRPRDGKAPPRKGVIFDEEEIHALWGLSPADVRACSCDGGAGRAGQPARGGKVVLEARRVAERGNKLKRLHALPPACAG